MSASSITVDAAGLYPADRWFNSILAYMTISDKFPVGQRVEVTRGTYKGKQGVISLLSKTHKIVFLDEEIPLYGASDEVLRKV